MMKSIAGVVFQARRALLPDGGPPGLRNWVATCLASLFVPDAGEDEAVGAHRVRPGERPLTGSEHPGQLARMVEQCGDAIIMADARGVLRIFNAEAERQHGALGREVAAHDWTRTFGLLTLAGEPLPLEDTPLYRALRGERVRDARWMVRRPDGALRALCGSASPLYGPDGRGEGAVLTARDETERLEQERACATALAQLHEAAEFRERFIGILGHDLRNPLSAIDLSARALGNSGALGDTERRLVGRIRSSSQRMAGMISELLDFTRTRLGGGMPVETRVSDLASICREAVEEVRSSHPGTRVQLRVLGHGAGEWDAGRLSQVVTNLVGNAVHYGPAGGLVRVTLRGEGVEEVVLHVHNGGPPIPPALLPTLFEPFRRGAQRAANADGLGLGLYIVRQIVLAHGGSLDVCSEGAKGTTFSARLPRIHPTLPAPALG